MPILKYHLTFLTVVVSFYCSVAIGASPLGDGHSEPIKQSGQMSFDMKKEVPSFPIEEILSPKQYLMRHLKTTKEKNLQEKLPDRDQQPTVVEKAASLNAAEKDAHQHVSPPDVSLMSVINEQSLTGEKKGTQTPTVDNAPLPIVTEEKAPSPPEIGKEKGLQKGLSADGDYHSIVTENKAPVDNQKKDIHSIPATPDSETLSVDEQQSPAAEKDTTQGYEENNKSDQPITGEKPPSSEMQEEKINQEKSLADDGHPPTTSFSETFPETKAESTPMTIATPNFHSEITAGEELEAKGTHTLNIENKSDTTIDGKETSLTPAEESSYTAKEKGPDVIMEGAKEPEKEISSSEPPSESRKETEDLKFTWEIWHTNPTLSIIIAVAITLIAAKIGGWLASMVKLPEVVGNLIAGIILGNFFFLTGSEFFVFLQTMPFLKVISYFGTLLLLLTAGLHTDIKALLRVGFSSFLVSLGGIIAPAGLGLLVCYFLLSDAAFSSKLLLAIIICNTSTGLLFAILSELKAMNTPEGRIITGATLLTEIIVILTFGIVSGIATKGEVSVMNVVITTGIAFSFLAIVLVIVTKYGERFGNFLTSKVAEGLKISIVIILSLMFAFISGSIGLHGVIGAFAAGLLLRNVKFKDSDEKEYSTVERIIRPYYMILVPILFVRVGAQVNLESILNKDAIFLGLAITGAAVFGKFFCSVCPTERGINRMLIGIGMAMKLEGTLILSGIGSDMGILDDTVFSSIILVIVFTSVLCPSLLKMSLARQKKRLGKNFRVTVDENTKEVYLQFKNEVQR